MPVAKVNGININYEVEGEGQPLVFIGGLGTDLSFWKRQLPTLKKHCKVVAFDNRGAGKSDKPNGPYSTRIMADDTVELLDSLGLHRADVLGYSLGGMIAQELAINYPERVARLILCSTLSNYEGESGLTDKGKQLVGLPKLRYLWELVSLVFDSPFRRIAQFIKRTLASNEAYVRGYRAQAEANFKHDTLSRLPLIKAPTLVLVGSNDRLIRPSSSDVLVSKIPSAKLVKIKDGSHDMCIEMSKAFNTEILNFLTSKSCS